MFDWCSGNSGDIGRQASIGIIRYLVGWRNDIRHYRVRAVLGYLLYHRPPDLALS